MFGVLLKKCCVSLRPFEMFQDHVRGLTVLFDVLAASPMDLGGEVSCSLYTSSNSEPRNIRVSLTLLPVFDTDGYNLQHHVA